MTPNNSTNLDNLERFYSQIKRFVIVPAKFNTNSQIEPEFERAIMKTEITIKYQGKL